jgi:ABC-type multidrug transport system fused ATPase/permease subunit
MFLLITSRYSKKVKTAGKQIQESAARMTGYHQALFENAKDLQISDGRKPEQKAEALDRKYEEDVRFKERLMQNIALIGEINGIASMLGIFLAGGIIAITTGLLNAGEVLIFVQLLNYIEQPITQLPAVKAAQSSALHMMQEVENSLPLPEEGTRLESDLESIQVSHVDFSYPETPVFEDLSLSFEKGKSTLILAPSGTGKSTLIQLLLSLQKPQKGDILYNGNKAEGMTADILFEQIGWMPQGYKLLENESYLENLMAEDGKQESIPWNMGFIKTEEQPVGEYSGGEKEKIYLSRIFLQNKPWMILDEPVKSLDPNEQVQVIKQLLALQKSLIVIMHTDDERILSQFDQVITLKNKNAEIQFNPSVNLSRQAFA